jgi:exodeoxyribonuclease VII large subunit
MTVHTVTELNTYIAECLADVFGDRVVEGEVSEFKPYPSGHWYFTLKDATSSLKCVMWKSAVARTKSTFRVGDKLRLFGGVTGYAVNGTYQFNTQRFERSGEGNLAQRLEELRARLGAEGLFDPTKKRSLPRFPRTIGIATAQNSAALADMLRVIGDRFPVNIVIAPCRVQGEGSAADIARAVRWLNADPAVDVIIVGRGGGSAEDLFAFNEEVAVRAVAGSRAPIISAVGHESDQCLCDLAADLRAPTPSAAAKAIVPDAQDIGRGLDVTLDRLDAAVTRMITRRREQVNAVRLLHPRERLARGRREVEALERRLHLAAARWRKSRERVTALHTRLGPTGGRIRVSRDRLGALQARLAPAVSRYRSARADRVTALDARLQALSPLRVLDRGYALVLQAGSVVRDAASLSPQDLVTVRFAKGAATARIEMVNPTGESDAER